MANFYPVRNCKSHNNMECAPLEMSRQFMSKQKAVISNGVNRREFLNIVAGGAAASAISFAGCNSQAAERKKSSKQPNIIFIMADDMGYADLGCYGQKHIKTPNINRLAVEGTRFTQCYTGSTVCAPSRSVLMTGQHTGHTRVRANFGQVGGVGPQKRVPLKGEDITVAEVVKQAGYVTGITGKWGLGEPQTTGVPNRQGFDEWLGYLNSATLTATTRRIYGTTKKSKFLKKTQTANANNTRTTCSPISP